MVKNCYNLKMVPISRKTTSFRYFLFRHHVQRKLEFSIPAINFLFQINNRKTLEKRVIYVVQS